MAKKDKYPYKFLPQVTFEEYKALGKMALIEEIKSQHGNWEVSVKMKKESLELKSIKTEIKEFKDGHEPEGLKELMDEIKALREKRDEEIEDLLEDKKALEGGFNDAINARKEAVEVLLTLLRKKS